MLNHLQALRAKIIDLRQQQSSWHSHSRSSRRSCHQRNSQRRSRTSEGLSGPKLCRQLISFSIPEASAMSTPTSSTVIPASLPSILPLFLPSFHTLNPFLFPHPSLWILLLFLLFLHLLPFLTLYQYLLLFNLSFFLNKILVLYPIHLSPLHSIPIFLFVSIIQLM